MRVGIVEDNRLFLDLLRRSLTIEDGFDVVSVASSATEAKRGFPAANLDVVVLDVELPDGNGIGLGATLSTQNPDLGVLLLSDRNHLDVFMMLPQDVRQGWSYLTKHSTASVAELHAAVRTTATGESYIDPALIVAQLASGDTELAVLTKRQLEVLKRVAAGDSNNTIADTLGIAPNSVGNHLIAIYNALNIPQDKNSRVTAVLKYIELLNR